MKVIKRQVRRLLGTFGYRLARKADLEHAVAVEIPAEQRKMIEFIKKNKFTMAGPPRLVATTKACRYVVQNKIAGQFVECGVWRGGNGILAKMVFENMGSDKQVYMFDTFGGMTEPTKEDVNATTGDSASKKYGETLTETHSGWCYASLEDVRNNCVTAGIDLKGIHFIKGDVCKTLEDEANLPESIAVLRLDTDWYESTKKELEVLYPRLVSQGVLLIDDYGHWQGARKAVDEYFKVLGFEPLLNVTDYTGRCAIKP